MANEPLPELLREKGMRPADLARALGINRASVHLWCLRRVPAGRVLEVERLTGIRREDLRPDLYPAPEKETTA